MHRTLALGSLLLFTACGDDGGGGANCDPGITIVIDHEIGSPDEAWSVVFTFDGKDVTCTDGGCDDDAVTFGAVADGDVELVGEARLEDRPEDLLVTVLLDGEAEHVERLDVDSDPCGASEISATF